MNANAGSESLLHHVAGSVGVAVLNRPAVLNVIDMTLIKALHARLETWRADPTITAVLVRGAGERAFCAGGDVRAVYEHRGDDAFMHEVYRVEYVLDDAIARYPKPYVALMTGIIMGGGCGISVHGSHRIVSDTTQIAMPECRIGLFPDIGASTSSPAAPESSAFTLVSPARASERRTRSISGSPITSFPRSGCRGSFPP